MKKAFLETSVFNKALDENVTSQRLLTILKKKDASPVIGPHVLYEIQKGFLYPKHRQKAIRLLDYCLELQPGLITTTNDLLGQEIARARYGSAVLTIMPAKFKERIWADLTRLKNNPDAHSAISFVKDREIRRKNSESLEKVAYIKHVKDVKSRVPHETKTLESFLKISPSEIPECIASALKGHRGLDAYVISRIASDLNVFPAIRALIRANMYRTWIYIETEKPPAPDKVDDGRQIIDASYSDFFVTADSGQIKLAAILNPELLVVSWQDFKRGSAGS